MRRLTAVFLLLGLVSPGSAGETPFALPTPHTKPAPTDPAWLSLAVQFHGHLGPWAAAGLRLGAAGRQAVSAQGYFDVEVVAEGPFDKPPQSCFLDGLQISTGATWGKRNIEWHKADLVVVRLKNTKTGKTAEVRPTDDLLQLLRTTPKADPGADPMEELARTIAGMPEKNVLALTPPMK